MTFTLQQSRDPVITIGVILDGVLQDSIIGGDLRKVAAAYYTLPATRGSYKLTVTATTADGCEDGATRPMTVEVR